MAIEILRKVNKGGKLVAEPASTSYSPASGATVVMDMASTVEHRVQMPAGNVTLSLTNEAFASRFLVSITQDSVGGRTVTWFATIKWAGGIVPTLTTTANKRDLFGFIRTGVNTYDGFIVGKNI